MNNQHQLNWIEPNQNPWKVRLLDLRPITQTMLSSSKDQRMAMNAGSFRQEDGIVFLDQKPNTDRVFETRLSFPIDAKLESGVLFTPKMMEHKWAIFFHESKILFVRSWLREVAVIAETTQNNNQLIVSKIHGRFLKDDNQAFTELILKFLMHSHVLKEMVPAPIPKELETDTDQAGAWAFSIFGNMAHYGHFESRIDYTTQSKIRSISLLHIAIARGQIEKIKEYLESGADINILAADGWATVHWAIIPSPEVLEFLLNAGANPDVESTEGATPVMNAAESNKLEHLRLLISYQADVNKRDKRGFTALHRAAELGHLEIVKELLKQGAEKEVMAEGHSAMSLAKSRNHTQIVKLLE